MAKNYKNDSIVSVDMDRVGVMAAYCDRCACVQFTVYEGTAFTYSELHTRTLCMKAVPSHTVNCTHAQRSEHAAIAPTLSMSTDTMEPFL